MVTGLLALVLAFLFVKDGDRFLPWLRRFVGPRAGGHLCVVLGRVWDTLGGFIRGQALVSLADAVPHRGRAADRRHTAGPAAGRADLHRRVHPDRGALIAGAVAVLIALVSNGFTAALIVLGIVLLVQQVEGNVLQPILQGKSLNLHAAVVLLAVTAGGSSYGIAGAFLAVPVDRGGGRRCCATCSSRSTETSEDDETDAPADPTAARAADVAPAPEQPAVAAASGPAVGDGPGSRGAVPEPRPDAPNPEQLELADDPDARSRGASPVRAPPPTALRDRT